MITEIQGLNLAQSNFYKNNNANCFKGNNFKSESLQDLKFTGLPGKGFYNHLFVNQIKPVISFQGTSAACNNLTVAEQLHEELLQLKADNSYNSPKLELLLKQFNDRFGTKGFNVTDLDDISKTITLQSGLELDSIRQSPQKLNKLIKTINAMRAATNYEPLTKIFQDYTLPVHNNEIAELMKSHYSSKEFVNLFDFCDKNNTFDLNIDVNTGLPKTSNINTGENWEMADRIWVTDTCRNLELMKKDVNNRRLIPKAIQTLSKFYTNQRKSFETIIANPQLYTPYMNLENKDDSFNYTGEIKARNGVGHILIPDTLNEDPNWFNRRRLESLGLYLKNSCDAITTGLGDKGNWGFNSISDVNSDVIDSISRVAKYLQAIDYPYAPSAGNWEEIPLPGGLTWDAESIKEGFQSLKKLLFDKKYNNNPQIIQIRQKLFNTKHGDLLKDKNELDRLIQIGEARVEKYHKQEAPGIRNNDASLAFVTQDSKSNTESLELINRNLETLETLENNLVRDNGVIRYSPFKFKLKDGNQHESPDSYLTYGYEIAVTPDGKVSLEIGDYKENFGAKDCSEPDIFAARSKLSPGDKYTAQWFMVSDISTGYGVQLAKLINIYKNETSELAKSELDTLIKKCLNKETEYINRAYARITGLTANNELPIKANGETCCAYKVPEAYMAVPTLDGKVKFLPGTNTPLTWAQTSLYVASEQYMDNLKQLESLGLLE